MVSIYSDGSSSGRVQGPGGYGWVIVRDEEKVLAWGYGGSPSSTNNLQEMEGAIQGLMAVAEQGIRGSEPIELVSDSQYVLGIASGKYQAQANLDTVARLREACKLVRPRYRWVRGHTGNRFNEHCDLLAKQGKKENSEPKRRPAHCD
jgi:ribonuclease HI